MSIPKEQYLGIYFKETDEDLIRWKEEHKSQKGRKLGDFVRAAIREKLLREQEQLNCDVPQQQNVILQRVYQQQQTILQVLEQLQQNLHHGKIAIYPSQPAIQDLDAQCVQAGWL